MTTQEFADIAFDQLNPSTWIPQENLACLATNDTVAVIRFRNNKKNYCIAATIGFCQKVDPRKFCYLLDSVELPECLPNGAEIPLWLTAQDAPAWS
jgi:hypothetical protein